MLEIFFRRFLQSALILDPSDHIWLLECRLRDCWQFCAFFRCSMWFGFVQSWGILWYSAIPKGHIFHKSFLETIVTYLGQNSRFKWEKKHNDHGPMGPWSIPLLFKANHGCADPPRCWFWIWTSCGYPAWMASIAPRWNSCGAWCFVPLASDASWSPGQSRNAWGGRCTLIHGTKR